jgi:uncharacterized protein
VPRLDEMNDRTCILTRAAGEPEGMIRFVAAPDMTVAPDLKRKLPGRGCWVTAERSCVDQAARKNLFRRALKAEVTAAADLGATVDRLLAQSALGALGLARKAGRLVLGQAKSEAAVRAGEALAVIHAVEAADDGVRKFTQARRAAGNGPGAEIAAYKLFSEAELGLALGATNVIHAALLAGEAGKAALKRVVALDRYRGGSPVDRNAVADAEAGAAEDVE